MALWYVLLLHGVDHANRLTSPTKKKPSQRAEKEKLSKIATPGPVEGRGEREAANEAGQPAGLKSAQ